MQPYSLNENSDQSFDVCQIFFTQIITLKQISCKFFYQPQSSTVSRRGLCKTDILEMNISFQNPQNLSKPVVLFSRRQESNLQITSFTFVGNTQCRISLLT